MEGFVTDGSSGVHLDAGCEPPVKIKISNN